MMSYGSLSSSSAAAAGQATTSEYTSKSLTSNYKSNIAPRTTVIHRTNVGPTIMTKVSHSYVHSGGAGGASFGMTPAAFLGAASGFSGAGGALGGLGRFGAMGVPMRPGGAGQYGGALVSVNETRMREKHQLSQLNDKFAQYVEKVRFLEAQNKKLQLELEALQKRASHGSSKIKEMYDIEMNEARKLIDASNRDRANAEMKAKEAEAERDALSRRYEEIEEREIADNEAKINLTRRRLADLEDEIRRYKIEVQRILAEINRVQNDTQNEIFTKSCLESEKMALEDELQMLNQVHDAELNELRSRSFVDGGLEPSQFFRNELANAIREIREEYENATEQQRNELHNRYMMQYNEIVMRHKGPDLMPVQYEQQRVQEEKLRTTLLTTKNEVAHMRARKEELNNRIRELQIVLNNEKEDGSRSVAEKDAMIEELRAKLDSIMHEHEEVMSMKTSLEHEINQYRELLEGSTSGDGLRQIVEHVEEEARRLETERLAGSLTATPGISALSRISGSLGGGGSSHIINRSVTYTSGGTAGGYAGYGSGAGVLSGLSSSGLGGHSYASSSKASSSYMSSGAGMGATRGSAVLQQQGSDLHGGPSGSYIPGGEASGATGGASSSSGHFYSQSYSRQSGSGGGGY
ncbi:hypothetical protein ACOME3_004132 [Neoechinorhynchus agilis]